MGREILGSVEDVFAIQEEISRKIVNALQLRLTDAEARGIAERPIDNAAAYDCYMRARHEVYRFTADGLDRAQKLVDAGLSLIGENSLLLATRGMVSVRYLNFSIRPEDRYRAKPPHTPPGHSSAILRTMSASSFADSWRRNAATWKVQYVIFTPHTSRSQAMPWC